MELINSMTFEHYPDAALCVEQYRAEGAVCLITNCNDGYLVDIYDESANDEHYQDKH